ncbi:MAG TPA: YifB family Mg chelatase-like AAA ATPase [Mycobacteriales bacterium]|nr:YifB family Mg chelatase-like AAA ATPase [Mycobacteriales bacterium]
MTLARSWSVGLVGLDGHLIEVEADIAQALPGFQIIGLPDAALNEAKDRVRAAVANSGLPWPASKKLTIGLSPAAIRKTGSAYDLAVACAILAADESVPPAALAGVVMIGELGLDGRVRPVPGVLPAVLTAVRTGVRRVVVPSHNAAEAALVPGVEVVGVPHLAALVRWLRGEPPVNDELMLDPAPAPPAEDVNAPDLRDVMGQAMGRRALEVAAAGGHHVFLVGPPGAGKTMLAERLPGLLPRLDDVAALEVTAVHSVAGKLPAAGALVTRPPFQSPHHSTTVPALLGGGSGVPKPGAVSLAHRGVLFMDEAPEFRAGMLEGLRQPLESGEITISRSDGTARYPARFLLVLAANPCSCVRASGKPSACTCSPAARRRYLGRLSGPLLDRVDIQLQLYAVGRGDLVGATPAEDTATVAARVAEAREAARRRFAGTPWHTNSEIPAEALRFRWPIPPRLLHDVDGHLDAGRLSARGRDRVQRLAWTVADLSGHDSPSREDVEEALALRSGADAVAA